MPGRGSRAPSPPRAAHLTPAQRDAFFEDGLVVVGKLLDEAAVAAIEVEYDRFMSGIHAEEMGKDFTDMSKPFGTPFDEWSCRQRHVAPPLPSV